MLNKFEKKIITSIRVIPVLVVLIFSVIVTYILSNQNEVYFEGEKKKLKKEYIQSQKDIVKHEVQVVYDLVRYEKNNTIKTLKENLKKRVYEANKIAINIYEKNKNKSPKEIKKLIKDALVSIRFNNGRGYFFIYDTKGINILHPVLKNIEDTNQYEYVDLKGKKVIKSLIDIVNKEGEGFDTWYWNKPDDLKKEYEKIGFVKKIEPLNWFIGTGEYLEDFEKEVKKQVLNRISQIKYDTKGYVFIIDYDGVYLNHIKSSLLNQNLLNLEDKNGVKLTKNIIEIAKKGDGYTQYVPIEGTGENEQINKISYIKGFNDWNWAIGSGFNPDLINTSIQEKYNELQIINNQTKNKIFITVVSVMVIILILLVFFSNEIEKLFKNYREKNNVYQARLKELLTDKSKMLDSSLDTIDKYVSITKTDLRGFITYATKNFCEGVGYTRAELIGKPHNIVRHPDTNPLIFEDMWKSIKKGNVYKTALKNKTREGGEVWFEVIIHPDYDMDQNIIGYTAIRQNITDKKVIEELKNKLEVRIEEAIVKSREKDNLLAHQAKMAAIGEMLENIAHQWRQPLSIISTAASGLELQKAYGLLDEKEFEKNMKTILDNTEYLSQTIDNFRDFFNSSNSLSTLDLKNVYTQAKTLIDSSIEKDSIHFVDEVESIEIVGYENELIQVILDIVNNSNDAFNNKDNKNKTNFVFIRTYKNQDAVYIEIKDNAGGIPEDILNKIFEPYFTTKHQSIGTGMGLYMCLEMVTKHMQGEISVKNVDYEYDKDTYRGAQFKIKLPLNPKTKLIQKIKNKFADSKHYEWDGSKNIFIRRSLNSDVSEEIEEITDFLHKYSVQYKILDNQDILLDFNKV